MRKSYTGIGSRKVPEEIGKVFFNIGAYLATQGFTLLSGGAPGSDTYFQKGCESKNGKEKIFIPSKGFNGQWNGIVLNKQSESYFKARCIAQKCHPAWDKCSEYAKDLHTRNVMQILDEDINTLTDFIVCWTPNGSGSGGTGQAIRIAKAHNVKIFDAGSYLSLYEFRQDLFNFLKNNYQLR